MLKKTARFMLSIALMITLCGALYISAPGTAWAATGDVGTPAPDFDLLIYQGGGATQTLSSLSGKVVMLFIVGYS
ncbi:MAG: hypothetical protein ACI9UQ_001251 [Candidatus Krumholzibacteriia bacterium]